MFILLFLFWILVNGKITLEIALIGLVLAAVIYLFACLFLNFSIKKDLQFCKNIHLFITFALLLVFEVIKSNLNIIILIWSNKTPEPNIVHFDVDLSSPFLRVLFANAITLTPGTITISVDNDGYIVHSLRKEYIDGIDKSILLKILKRIERRMK